MYHQQKYNLEIMEEQLNKIKCVIYAPIYSYSNFGIKGRDLIHAILELKPDWNIEIVAYTEKNTRFGFNDESITPYVKDIAKISKGVDIWFNVGTPFDFVKRGQLNIGVTDSFIYKDVDKFISNCNEMNAIFTFSTYSSDTIKSFKIEENKITTPIYILPEYSHIHGNNYNVSTDVIEMLNSVETSWNFLCEGQWEINDSAGFGGWNKDNIKFVVLNFLKNFSDIPNAPGLILNVHGHVASILDRTNIIKEINNIIETECSSCNRPSIYLINEDMNYEQLYNLYNSDKIKALIHIPQRSDSVQSDMEFMSSGKPIIFSDHAAQKRILNYEGNLYTRGGVQNPKSGVGPVLIDTPQVDIQWSMYEMYLHYDKYLEKSKTNSNNIISKYTRNNYLNVLNNLLSKIKYAE